ncbi:MAG: glycerophosphodiester phosphodiesterase, partial [Acidobacteria bacterium]|nr:glycerophosphodiester phosphodiesterase [Acidobacteriota bacterium]
MRRLLFLTLLVALPLVLYGQQARTVSIEGHRGTRGHLPENTIPSFKKAIDLGADTLELDVVITKD